MSPPRIYIDQPISIDQPLSMTKEKSQHLLKVLRLKVNDHLILFNGKDGEYLAKLIGKEKSCAIILPLSFKKKLSLPPLSIHLGQAISKGQRMDYALQKATELGVTSITPLYTKRGNVKLDSYRLKNRIAHWEKVMIHAAEQSERYDIPTLKEPEKFCQTKLLHLKNLTLITTLQPNRSIKLPSSLPEKRVTLLIGPEGGFEPSEIELALKRGAKPLNLGTRTLRTETATVVGLAFIQLKWGDIAGLYD